MMKRLITIVAGAALTLGLILVVWQWYRVDSSITFFQVARDYLHNDMGLPLQVVTVIAAAGAIGVFAMLGMLLLRPGMAVAAILVLLLVALPLSYWLTEAVAPKSCFDRQTGAALCARWQAPEGCLIARKDGARPPGPWRYLREATEEDVAFCRSSVGDEPRVAVTPRPVLSDSCTGQVFFDATGTPLVFWSVDDKAIELWDRQGHHPITGVTLKAITTEIAGKYCEQLIAAQREREEIAERERLAVQAEETTRLQLEAKAPQAPQTDNAASPSTPASGTPAPVQLPVTASIGETRPVEAVLPREPVLAPPRPVDSSKARDPYGEILVR